MAEKLEPPGLKIASKKKKSKKNNAGKKAKGKSNKATFQKYFDNFFPRLYYAKKLSDIKPYYSSRFMKGSERLNLAAQKVQMKKLRQAYVSKHKIEKVIMHPGGKSCDVKILGAMSVYRRKGFGYVIYRMVNENDFWRIDSFAFRSKMWH